MVDTILDDVKELLKQEKGDPKILERIKRAAEQGEVISVYERDYISKLVNEHLRPKFEELPKQTEIATESTPKPQFQTNPAPEPSFSKPPSQKPLFESKSNPKTTKMMFAIGAVALAVILVIGISYSDISLESNSPTTISSPTTTTKTTTSDLGDEVDTSSYSLGDIISISGNSKNSGDVTLSIINVANQIIWQEKASLKTDGTYSTLAIAGGPGWESAGEYTLKETQGSLTEEIQFNFKK